MFSFFFLRLPFRLQNVFTLLMHPASSLLVPWYGDESGWEVGRFGGPKRSPYLSPVSHTSLLIWCFPQFNMDSTNVVFIGFDNHYLLGNYYF